MSRKPPIHLVDESSAPVAQLDVQLRDGVFEGTIHLESTPPSMRKLFEQYEECVEGQMFSLLDDLEDRLAALRLRAILSDGTEADVVNLQVYPSRQSVSLSICQPAKTPSH